MKAGTVPTEIECLLLSGIVLGVSRILPFNPPTLQYRQVLLSSSFYTNCWFINLLIPSFPPSLTYLTIMGPAPVIHSFNKHIPSILETFYRANCFDPKKAYYEHWRHSPRGPNVILRPHALCLEWSGCLTLHLPSFSSPANYALTPLQTSKLKSAHICSDNSHSVKAQTECILMRCIIAQHNGFIH